MKFPNHIIIDINKSNVNTSTHYWALKYVNRLTSSPFFIENFYSKKKLLNSKEETFNNSLFTSNISRIGINKLFNRSKNSNLLDKTYVSSKLWSIFNIFDSIILTGL